MKSVRACGLFYLCACLLEGCGSNYAKCPDPVDGTYEAPNGAGALVVQDGVRILKLHGNAGYETAYAYGYLLAAEIVYIVDNLIMPIVHERGYESLRDSMALVDWDNAYGEDLEGMLAGIQARLRPREQIIHPYPWRRGRRLELVDLQLVNSMSDWLCSSFSVWGPGRADGSTLYARNLDYYAGRNDALSARTIDYLL
jgi:hypothetical protein